MLEIIGGIVAFFHIAFIVFLIITGQDGDYWDYDYWD